MKIAPHDITGLILAGGPGIRMGGLDKGLQPFRGVPMVWHALKRLQAQTGTVAINANRHRAAYAALQVPVWADPVPAAPVPASAPAATPDQRQPVSSAEPAGGAPPPAQPSGPLVGFLTGLTHCTTPWLLTVPCDTPRFPLDLVARLAAAAEREGAEIALAAAPQTDADGQLSLQPQPVFCLLRTSLRDDLAAYLHSGERRVSGWLAQHHCVQVAFDQPHDDPLAFFNANTATQLQTLESLTA